MPIPEAGFSLEFLGSVSGAGVVNFQRGGLLVRTGVGIYTLTLEREAPAGETVVLVTPRTGAGNANAQVAHTSNTVKGITLFVGAVATDVAFDVAVFRATDTTL